MNRNSPALPAFVLSAIALVGIVVLAALSHPIPQVLTLIAAASVGGGLGIIHPTAEVAAAPPATRAKT
jgi:hypothetical protein